MTREEKLEAGLWWAVEALNDIPEMMTMNKTVLKVCRHILGANPVRPFGYATSHPTRSIWEYMAGEMASEEKG